MSVLQLKDSIRHLLYCIKQCIIELDINVQLYFFVSNEVIKCYVKEI